MKQILLILKEYKTNIINRSFADLEKKVSLMKTEKLGKNVLIMKRINSS